MNYKDINPGDRVVDPFDGEIREVIEVRPHDDSNASVFMEDGGVMGSEEITRVYLPGENIEGK